uniref:Uncharacterized protein n=1 Tax=Anguilla anguilla TaxID=7936 RepID=A0A0E9UQU9_ANGAN
MSLTSQQPELLLQAGQERVFHALTSPCGENLTCIRAKLILIT